MNKGYEIFRREYLERVRKKSFLILTLIGPFLLSAMAVVPQLLISSSPDRVQQLAQNGFGKHVRYVTDFDPSLPPVLGNRDQLVQAFLNLIKNAAEAVPAKGGEIILETAYQQGVRFAGGILFQKLRRADDPETVKSLLRGFYQPIIERMAA